MFLAFEVFVRANKSLKFVPALRASTGRSKAAPLS